MKAFIRSSFIILATLISCYTEQEIAVVPDFSFTISENNFTAPVELTLSNHSTGADFYQWTLEGSSIEASTKKNPGTITYNKAGTYIIKLEAWNDTQHHSKEIEIQIDSAVSLDFDVNILVNDFAPASVVITNHTRGASTYEWTFEGGEPETSTSMDPGGVVFASPGEHTVTLRVSNGRETFTASKSVVLKEVLNADFEIQPSFEDADYEAPLTATLTNKTVSGLHYTWRSSGGVIANATDENTSIHFAASGEYKITLEASNDKETQTVERNIVVKSNTNLYILNDVKLGVSAAHTTLGCFYSTKLRQVIRKDEVTSTNDALIDLVFYGVNSSFGYCRFISPDSASKFTFPEIPQASHTHFVNVIESSSLVFTSSTFDAMINDTPLLNLDIENQQTGTEFFANSITPRIVLFQTQDGRKGVIKIKSFVADGVQSYILLDIKVQKLKS